MKHDWVIDVLSDLRQYAIANYRIALAEQLDDAIMVAAAESGVESGAGSGAGSGVEPGPEPGAAPRRASGTAGPLPREEKRSALTSIRG